MASPTAPTDTRSRLAKLAGLDAVERPVLIAAWCLLPLISVSLRILDYPRTRDLMAWFLTRKGNLAASDVQVERTARLVGVAARYELYRPSCLSQALAAWWLLARRGVVTSVRIGVQKDRRGFSAHAWVERDGMIIMGGADARERYLPML